MMKKFILDLLALADSRVMITMELPVTMTVNKIQRKVNCSTYKYHITEFFEDQNRLFTS